MHGATSMSQGYSRLPWGLQAVTSVCTVSSMAAWPPAGAHGNSCRCQQTGIDNVFPHYPAVPPYSPALLLPARRRRHWRWAACPTCCVHAVHRQQDLAHEGFHVLGFKKFCLAGSLHRRQKQGVCTCNKLHMQYATGKPVVDALRTSSCAGRHCLPASRCPFG